MSRDSGDDGAPRKLDALVAALEAARKLAAEVTVDPLARRLVTAVSRMPLEDRDVIVGAIEREVQARRLSLATEQVTGQAMHPNPNARLYLRSFQSGVARSILERDEMMLAMLSMFRVAPILLVPEIHAAWIEATRAALAHADASTCGVVEGLLREALGLVAEAAVASAPDRKAVGG